MTRCRHKPPHLLNNFNNTITPTIPEDAEDEPDDPPVVILPAQPEDQAEQHLLLSVPVTDDQQAPLPPQPPDGHPGGQPSGQQADGPVQHGGRVTRSQTRKHRQNLSIVLNI